MTASQPLAPPVVSVTVVHEPGPWFDEMLRSLAAQDYTAVRHVFLVTEALLADGRPVGDGVFEGLAARIRSVLPDAFVRPVAGNPGFGPVANEVLRLVEGDGGLFLICHDDVVLSRSTVRLLVTELVRSNAGIVGPKLVDWHEPRRLQHVGLGLDRFGEVDPVVDEGEFDQEQHDAVRDVFVLPTACILVRADLFRVLGGFDPAISFHGDDVDLCWRAHLTGARVVVVPDARVRHLQALDERRPDLPHRRLAARHRMRAVATLTGSSRLAGRMLQLVLLTVAELVIGLFSGRSAEAWASTRALVGLVPRTWSVVTRRAAVRHQRVVPEREVLATQARGSARLNSFVRSRETATFVGEESTVRRWREASFGPFLAWFLVILAIVVGSRSFIRSGVPAVGEFLPMSTGPTDLWASFRSGFDARGVGGTAATPTGWAVLSVVGVLALGRMALVMTGVVVGSGLVGALGVWRLLTVFPSSRARVIGLVVYVGSPLLPFALGAGDATLLVWFAVLPWMLHLAGRSAGLAAADPFAARSDHGDGLVDGREPVATRELVRITASLVLVTAIAASFVPALVVAWPVVALAVALGTVLAGGSWSVAGRFVFIGLASAAGAVALNLPWSSSWDRSVLWSDVGSIRPPRGLLDVLSLSGDDGGVGRLAAALLVPLFVAVAVGRAWRLTWAVRALVMTFVFGAALLVSDRGYLASGLPDRSILVVPVALGCAIGAGALVEGTGADVLEQGFGWRQPLAVIANLAIVIGLVPGVVSIGDGAWGAPSTPLPELVATQFPADPIRGDHRVLYVGDPELIPVPSFEYTDGIGFAVVDSGPLRFTDRFPRRRGPADDAVVGALDLMASSSTLRIGRLLAPLGVRYVVVPETDGVVSTDDAPIPLAEGLVASLQNQLDIGAVYGLPSLRIFENLSWMPVTAIVTGPTADASALAGQDVLARADLSNAVMTMPGLDAAEPSGSAMVSEGVLHVGVPFDERLELRLDGVRVMPRPGFGVTTAFDLDRSGEAVLSYREDAARRWWVAVSSVLWLVTCVLAVGARARFVRGPMLVVHDETLIHLDADPTGRVHGEVLAGPDLPNDAGDEPADAEAHRVPLGPYDGRDGRGDETTRLVVEPADDPADDPVVEPVDDLPAAVPRAPLVVEPRRPGPVADDESLAALVARVDQPVDDPAADDPGRDLPGGEVASIDDIDWDDIDRDLGLPPGGST